MAHLKTRATRQDVDDRLRWKLQIVRHLYHRGFQRRDVQRLFRFIDWLMALPEELEERVDDELRQLARREEDALRHRVRTASDRKGSQ